MAQTRLARGFVRALVLAVIFGAHGIAAAAEPAGSKTSDGLTVYFGVVPAELVKGPPPHSTERPMHGRIPRDPREYHVVAAVFDAVTGARVSDVSVTAKVSGLGLSGTNKRLEAMEIAGTTTYGAFFNLPGRDLYTVHLAIERPGLARQVVVDFKYDLRR
jgi:hypothetical protein